MGVCKPVYQLFTLILGLGEKFNRLAYLQIVTPYGKDINYNNYSPNLPYWPFVINVTSDYNGCLNECK